MSDRPLLIVGGTIASEYGTFRADIVIQGERIAGLVEDSGDIDGDRVDATGLTIFPGGIDMHVHMREPSRLERENFYYGTASAAAGGITTVIEMPQAGPLVSDLETFRLKRDLAAAGSLCDFGLYVAAIGQEKHEFEALLAEGAMGFKAFLCASSPGYPRLDDAMLLTCLQRLHDLDALLVVHAENDDLLQAGLARMAAEGRKDPLAHAESRPPIVEIEAISRVVRLAAFAGTRLHVAHVSTVEGVGAVTRAHSEGARVTCETCPQYLLMDLDDLARLGPYARCAPAIRDRSEVEGLWPLVVDGSIQALSSDHSPYIHYEKDAGYDDIFRATLGLNIIQTMLPAVADEGFHRRGLSLTAFARLTAAEPARILGLYPRKGSIQVGASADLALWDLDQAWEVRREDLLSRHPWTPLEGRQLRGRPVSTIRRGSFIYRDGAIVPEPGRGIFLRPQQIRTPVAAL
jgi:allantoinase